MRRASRGRALRGRGRRRTAARSRASTRGRRRTATRSKALLRAPGASDTGLTVAGLLDYVLLMEEPLERALDLARGLMLATQGMDDARDGRALLALGRAVNGELHQVKGMFASLMKVRAEMT